jgi:hypothetical protein
MPELGFHMMLRPDDDRVLAPSAPLRRSLARSVYRTAEPFPLLGFGAADNHLHLAVLGDRRTAGDLAHRVMCSLHWSLGLAVTFFPVRYKPLESQHHLRSTFHYALNQRNRHGVQSDPYLDASSLPELLGMRVLPTSAVGLVREHLPRTMRRNLLPHLGTDQLEPAEDDHILTLMATDRHDLLRDAAAGAVGIGALTGNQPEVVAARAALVQVLARCSPTRAIAEVVERHPTRVRQLRARPADQRLLRAVRLQLALRVWLNDTHPDLIERDPERLPQLPTS